MSETIREAYIRKNPKSAELFPRFKEVLPGGTESRSTPCGPLSHHHC